MLCLNWSQSFRFFRSHDGYDRSNGNGVVRFPISVFELKYGVYCTVLTLKDQLKPDKK